jgi:hypothetical protein
MIAPIATLIPDSEQEHFREALQRLLTRGAILREDNRDLYDWARVQRSRLDELANLLGLKLAWEHDSRLILAVPQGSRLLRRLKQDETLFALALWYDFDRAVKDEGKTPDDVQFKVSEFNEQLQAKFRNLKLPSETRCAEILRLFERKSLVRLENTAGDFAQAVVRVLPTIRFLIPFQDIEDWNRARDRQMGAETSVEPVAETEESLD